MPNQRYLSRRGFLLLAGGAAAATGARLLPGVARQMLRSATPAEAQISFNVDLHLAATDGWIYVPGSVPNPGGPGPLLPDALAPVPFTAYAFGFRDVTGLTQQQVLNQKGKTQASAPLLYVDELDNVRITLTNLGLQVRPDLTDSHTIHFHGFRNAIPLFDGVPEMSIAVPIGRDFPYFFVRPRQNKTGGPGIPVARLGGNTASPVLGYAYNDGVPPGDPNSTAYDREWGMFLSELWTLERFHDAHIQESDWSEYQPDVWMLNGRTYPQTLAPSGGPTDSNGDLIAPPGFPALQYQPISSLITANPGERVLLRFVNLGFQQHAMTLNGIPMRVVGKDATLLRGRDGTFTSYLTDTVYIGPGESVDAIFVAPPVATQTTYLLYNRNYAYLHNPGQAGLGGQMTEVRISPSGVPPQLAPNT